VGAAAYRTRYWTTPNDFDKFLANRLNFNVIKDDPRGCEMDPMTKVIFPPVFPPVDGRVPVQVVDRQTLQSNGAIDWNNNFRIDAAAVMQDIGGLCGLDSYSGSNDWPAIDLQQTGSRRNYLAAGVGPGDPVSAD